MKLISVNDQLCLSASLSNKALSVSYYGLKIDKDVENKC